MWKLTLTHLLFSLTLNLLAQRPQADTVSTEIGELVIQPIKHGAMVLSWKDQVLYIDPYGGVERFKGIANPNIILITDNQSTHLDMKTLGGLNTEGSIFIVPKVVKDKLPNRMKLRAAEMEHGQTLVIEDIEVLVIPKYGLAKGNNSKNGKAGNGYVLNIGGNRIYISGDTENIPEMRNLKNIDIAFISMNLINIEDLDQRMSELEKLQPSIVYPYHYQSKNGVVDVELFKSQMSLKNPEIEVRLRNWYPE